MAVRIRIFSDLRADLRALLLIAVQICAQICDRAAGGRRLVPTGLDLLEADLRLWQG